MNINMPYCVILNQSQEFLRSISNKIPIESEAYRMYKPEKALKRRAQKVHDVCHKEPELA